MMPLDMLANLCNDGMTPLTDNSESMMATILDCNILNSMVIIGKETMKPETHKVGCLQAADALKRLGMCADDLAKTRDKGIVAAIQYFAFNLTDGAPSAASKVGSQIDDGCDASAETLVDEALRCSNATYSPGEVSGRPSEAEVLASDAPTVVPTHEVSIATSEPPCTASSAFEAHGEPAENGLLGIATEESKSRCPEVGEMASHNIADRFNMNDRFASIDDDDDISFCRDQLQPARETQQGCENHEEYELEDDGNGRDNSEDTNLDVGAEEEGPMETIDEDSDEMYDLGSLPLNLNAAAGHSAVTDFASPIDYNTPSATDAVLDAFFDNVFWRMKPLDVDLPILAPIDSNNSSLNLMDADVDVPNGKRETIAEIDADVDEEAMSLAEDLVNASDANVGHEGGVDFAETEGDLEADAGLMATTNVPKDRSETTAEMAVDAGKDVMSLAEGLVNASDANVGHEGGVDFAETEGAVEADAGLMATTNVPVYLVEGGDDFTPLGQRVNEPTPATSPASNVGITEPVKNEAVTIEEQSEDIGHMIMLAERYALHGRSRRGNGCRGSRNARQPPSQEELRRIALVTRFKK